MSITKRNIRLRSFFRVWRHGTGRIGGRAGFTLMEVLVAMAVLTLGLVSIYQAYIGNVQIYRVTKGLWKAIVFANNEMGRIERQTPPSVSISQGVYRDDHPMKGYTWRREVTDEEALPGVKVRRVFLELKWDAEGIPQRYTTETYVQAK